MHAALFVRYPKVMSQTLAIV